MKKEKIFSKIAKKDYEFKLEEILEKKQFSESAKNLILRTFYKIDTNYDDYNRVKILVMQKNEWIKNFLDWVTNLQENDIGLYDTEEDLIRKLAILSVNGFEILPKYPFFSTCFKSILIKGNAINNQEIVRDFNGWSWVIHKKQIADSLINLTYQMLIILLEPAFLENWLKDEDKTNDHIENLKAILIKKFGKKNGEVFFNKLVEFSLKFSLNFNKEYKKEIEMQYKKAKKEIELEQKEDILSKATEEKKKLINQIMQIDTILNDKRVLEKEFVKRNKLLETKITNIETFIELLKKQKQNIYRKINTLNKILDPREYLKRKDIKEEKIRLVENLNLLEVTGKDVKENLESLQKIFLDYLKEKFHELEDKKEIIHWIYILRYYTVMVNNLGDSVINISKELKDTQVALINSAYKQKLLNIVCEHARQNDEIISKIFETNMIELTDTEIKVRKNNDNLGIEIYNKSDLEAEFSMKMIDKKRLKMKLNKKIRVFL